MILIIHNRTTTNNRTEGKKDLHITMITSQDTTNDAIAKMNEKTKDANSSLREECVVADLSPTNLCKLAATKIKGGTIKICLHRKNHAIIRMNIAKRVLKISTRRDPNVEEAAVAK